MCKHKNTVYLLPQSGQSSYKHLIFLTNEVTSQQKKIVKKIKIKTTKSCRVKSDVLIT